MSILRSILAAVLLLGGIITAAAHPFSPPNPTVNRDQVARALAGLAIPFEANQGQTDPRVAFQARTLAGPLFVTTDGELVWNLTRPSPPASTDFVGPPTPPRPGYSVVERFVGGQAQPAGALPAPTQVSYFHGNDREQWRHGVPTWSRVNLGQVWPGIEVSLAARGQNAEKLFTVAPGAEASAIVLEMAGGTLTVDDHGGLRVANGEQALVTFTPPVAWQEIDGQRQPVTVAYQLAGDHRYGFTLGAHDPTQPVWIDPAIESTYLGGSGDEQASALAVTTDAVYVAGYTASSNFPGTAGGPQSWYGGGNYDVFVAKLDLDLTTLPHATYLGGYYGYEWAYALAVTANAVYVAGYTESSNFPSTAGGAQAAFHGFRDAFVAKLSLDLKTLTQATYLGGSSDDYVLALAVTANAVYVAGNTGSSNFPGTAGGVQAAFGGGYDGYVAKLNLDLTTLTQATYLGGSGGDFANALAVTADAVYVAGMTYGNFPGTAGGAQAAYRGNRDSYVAKLSLDLKTLTQATYLGGSSWDEASIALAVTADAVYVAGDTSSSDFPGTTNGAQPGLGGGGDAFVAELSLDLKTLTQATYLGGSSNDGAYTLAVTADAVYVAGPTNSSNFPGTTGGAQAAFGGGSNDAFVAKLSRDLKTLTQAIYLGGSSDDYANALAVTADTVYVAGNTGSSNFPGTDGGAQAALGGGSDAFVAKLALDLTPAVDVPDAPTIGKARAGNEQATVNFTAPADDGGSRITAYTVTASPGGQTATGSASPLTVTGLTNGTVYTFTVTATNAVGTGPASAASNSVTPAAVTTTTITTSQNPTAPGQSVTFTAQVTAASGTPTGSVMFQLDGGTVTTANLSTGRATFTSPPLTSGRHTISARYMGNGSFRPSTDQLTQVVSPVDFVVTAMTLTPTSPAATGTFRATVTVKNQGTESGNAGNLVVWANQATVATCGTAGDQTVAVGTLAAGASTTLTVSGLPAGASGTKTLRAFIDAACTTTESNEANNQLTKSYTVVLPDFVVTGVTLTPVSPIANSAFRVAVTVKNQGTGSGDAGNLVVWANQATAPTCGTAGNQTVAVGTLAAGASRTLTVSQLPAGASGAKTLRAFIDAACTTTESNEANNQLTKSYTVR